MSYARFSEWSDVYVYEHCDLGLICEACIIEKKAVKFKNEIEVLKHLYEHIKKGNKVLPSTISALWEEWEEKKESERKKIGERKD